MYNLKVKINGKVTENKKNITKKETIQIIHNITTIPKNRINTEIKKDKYTNFSKNGTVINVEKL